MSGSGQFIVLEGIDGSGTTTQAERLVQRIRETGHEAILTREPTTGPIGRFLRQALVGGLSDADGSKVSLDWTSMALLFAADRLDHVKREIQPALDRGATVVSDRYDLSGLIYQSETSPEGQDSLSWLREMNARARRPDLTLVLHVEASVAEERRAARAGEPELFEKAELQRRLSIAYRAAHTYLPDDDIDVLEARGDQDQVAELIEESMRVRPEFAWIGQGRG